MGWGNYHLFEFRIAGYRIGEVNEEFIDYGFGNDQLINCMTTVLNDIFSFKKRSDKIDYIQKTFIKNNFIININE